MGLFIFAEKMTEVYRLLEKLQDLYVEKVLFAVAEETWNYLHMGQVTELWLSCYLVLLSTDSKTR